MTRLLHLPVVLGNFRHLLVLPLWEHVCINLLQAVRVCTGDMSSDNHDCITCLVTLQCAFGAMRPMQIHHLHVHSLPKLHECTCGKSQCTPTPA